MPASRSCTQESVKGRRRLVRALAVVLLSFVAVAVAATGAIFTDTDSVGSNTFTSGTVDISTSPASAVVAASNMAPGDISGGSITVSNDGSLQLRYAVARSATNVDLKALRDALRVRIASQGGGACNFPYYTVLGATTAIGDDTELFEGLGFPATATNTIGDVAQGAQAGDRLLNAAASEVLCVSVVLPLSAGNLLQNATTDVTFDFVAEQTANN